MGIGVLLKKGENVLEMGAEGSVYGAQGSVGGAPGTGECGRGTGHRGVWAGHGECCASGRRWDGWGGGDVCGLPYLGRLINE
jgi:hypothetical protein